ncbi:MAG TPA: hypothetical protein PLB78_14505 [Anaerolineae bacterium]|nr:hypothetical protein [Anaerolineae bacterium]
MLPFNQLSLVGHVAKVELVDQDAPDSVLGEKVGASFDAVSTIASAVQHCGHLAVGSAFSTSLKCQQEPAGIGRVGDQDAIMALVGLAKMGADLICAGHGTSGAVAFAVAVGRIPVVVALFGTHAFASGCPEGESD